MVSDKNMSLISLSFKTKFKEQYEDRFDTADKDILMMKEKFNLMDVELIYPKKISIKFLLNQPKKEILPYLQFTLNKINSIKEFGLNFYEFDLQHTTEDSLDFGYLQKQLLNILLSHYEPNK
jgi:hypothetical protein